MSSTAAPTLRSELTRLLFWRMGVGLGLLSLLAFAALHGLLARQQHTQLERRVVKLTDIAVKAERDRAILAERLADYAPRRPGTRLVVTSAEGRVIYEDPDLPAHRLSPHVRRMAFVPAGLSSSVAAPRFEITVDVADDVELTRAMGSMLLVITLLAAWGARWTGADAVRRGLAPLERLSEQLAGIEPASLGRRLTLSQPLGELQPWIEHFNALLVRLEQAYRQLENFNADVAHELRTPLNNLIGQTEVALSRPRTQAQLQETLSSNLEELHRLGSLVHDMLFLSRADRGAKARREQPLSLAALAHEVVEFHEAAIDERGLRVEVVGDARVAVDAGLLRRAVSNLLSNAARHAAANTVIRIEIGTGHAAAGYSPSEEVALTVLNRGLEISPENLPRIFDRFFRADVSRNASELNHGLGLAIVAAIARMHGGLPLAHSAAGETRIGLTISGKNGDGPSDAAFQETESQTPDWLAGGSYTAQVDQDRHSELRLAPRAATTSSR
jgi:two-component system, OmpR family, heavy metal sensor histidine kinase CusS